MQYIEKHMDLFDIKDPNTWFVQCISADFACGKGIAMEFIISDLIQSRNFKSIINQIYGMETDIVWPPGMS